MPQRRSNGHGSNWHVSTDHHPAFHVGIQVMNGPPTVIAKWR
jgi:hypothetical protein